MASSSSPGSEHHVTDTGPSYVHAIMATSIQSTASTSLIRVHVESRRFPPHCRVQATLAGGDYERAGTSRTEALRARANLSINDPVVCSDSVLEWAVVAAKIVACGNEAICPSECWFPWEKDVLPYFGT
ncbi:hypothetical protein PV04_10789 [Phialophora macrospora]|uniref:Uncharacterized protein n=1 Tax=Phialophora macrospora TaxID=1851006 RepID=A0A0D2DJT0_9EURO|nr:hypothetical protein PV04_10789 [Phialophora macrospora]